MTDAAGAVADAGAEAYPRIVAALIRVTGDWTLAEDCAQEALAAALERWPRTGVPDNPGGWLMTAARNRAVDVLRRASVERRKLRDLALLTDPAPAPPEGDVVDDRLRLIFTCCHPALALEGRVALTLRTVAGVPTADIARAFLVTESTMTRRLTLDQQDRDRWDRPAIAEGVALLARAGDGPYALQARIAAAHATAPTAAATDWPAIAGCYDALARLQPTPVIGLNRAVAHGYAYGPAAGLALLAEARAGGALDGYPPAVAAEAELTARLGDPVRAAALFRAAADAVRSEPERRALLRRAADLSP
ncbi:RNA polymerase subunit sigma-24 [Micromonospora sp. AP08]|uniref:sigma factor n=1 Tax=Micromonospora sp. AP08 TaxID=2604467 RepID=UPI0011D89F6F|nr:RNA polymerase subunit sigma-24 [Micromonospora sp. AP08]